MTKTTTGVILAQLDAKLRESDAVCDHYLEGFVPTYWFATAEIDYQPARVCNVCYTYMAAYVAGEEYLTRRQCDWCESAGVPTVPHMARSMADPMHTWVFRLCAPCAMAQMGAALV